MNIKQVIFINISFFISLTVLAADRPTQPVRTEVYRLERLDSVLLVDLAVDLTGVHLAPDCTVYLFPLLASENTGDSLSLPPIVLNGPQSDLMYRRRRALGTTSGLEKITPYTVLREGDHALPRIHYRTEVPYAAWTMLKYGCATRIAIVMPVWYLLPCIRSIYRRWLWNGWIRL